MTVGSLEVVVVLGWVKGVSEKYGSGACSASWWYGISILEWSVGGYGGINLGDDNKAFGEEDTDFLKTGRANMSAKSVMFICLMNHQRKTAGGLLLACDDGCWMNAPLVALNLLTR